MLQSHPLRNRTKCGCREFFHLNICIVLITIRRHSSRNVPTGCRTKVDHALVESLTGNLPIDTSLIKTTVKIKTLIAVLMLSPLSAFAGKAERDFVSTQVEPAVKEAAATLKKSCGCDVKFDVKVDTFKDTDELMTSRNFANAVKSAAPGYCNDAPSKAAICKVKTFEVSKGSSVTFKFAGGKGIVTTDSSSYPSWDMVTREVDK